MTAKQAAGEAPVRVLEGGFGARFMLKLVLTVAVGLTLVFATLYLLFSRPLQGGYGSAYAALQNLTEPWLLLPIVGLPVLIYAVAVCVAAAILCIYALHKVAGPMYRMDRVVDDFVSGDTIRPVFFRTGDQAAVLADAFNAFVSRLREDRKGWQDAMSAAEVGGTLGVADRRAAMARAAGEIARRAARYH